MQVSFRGMQEHTPRPIPFIRELCKHKTEDEILEAEDRFRDYLMLIKEISELDEEQGIKSIDEIFNS